MITIKDAIKFEISPVEIKNIIKKVVEAINISTTDNIRNRHPNIQFDCLLRGYIGEFCIVKWLESNGVFFSDTNYIQDSDNIDIDFLYKEKNIELKTSLVPDVDRFIETAIAKRDIKLIKRGNTNINDLRGDLHLQIYFDQKRKSKDDWLKVQNINLKSVDLDYLYNSFCARAYQNSAFFVGWIDKDKLVNNINALDENNKCWSFSDSKRFFWNCKIQTSRKPIDLIDYLRSI